MVPGGIAEDETRGGHSGEIGGALHTHALLRRCRKRASVDRDTTPGSVVSDGQRAAGGQAVTVGAVGKVACGVDRATVEARVSAPSARGRRAPEARAPRAVCCASTAFAHACAAAALGAVDTRVAASDPFIS